MYNKKELDRQYSAEEISKDIYDRRLRLLNERPLQDLKDAYFLAIEGALEVKPGNLWVDPRGRTFAGYAPVLESIGTLLASVDNPITVTNRLNSSSTRDAWDVIETVVQEILQREKTKLVDKLSEMTSVPQNAYDPEEQLKYLTQLIGGQTGLILTGDVIFANENDASIYLEKISQICKEHPFVRSGKMANNVLGARILSHALCNGTELNEVTHFALIRDLSKGPFLWRSIRRELLTQESPFLDGRFVGYILNSYWNDPMEEIARKQTIEISEKDDGLIAVQVGSADNNVMDFAAMPPVSLYERVRNCRLNAADLELVIEGATLRGGESSLFRFQGKNAISCSVLQYGPKTTEVSGSLWLDAAQVVVTTVTPDIQVRGEGKYGWGEAVRNSEPWKKLSAVTVANPFRQTLMSKLFAECQQNIPANGIVLMGDYSIPESDPQLMWTKKYGEAFPSLLKLLVSSGRAGRELVQTRRRENKYRIRLNDVPWVELQNASRGDPGVGEQALALFNEIRDIMD